MLLPTGDLKNSACSGFGGFSLVLSTRWLYPIHLSVYRYLQCCCGFAWQGFDSGGATREWLLWEAARSFPCLWQSQCQPALCREDLTPEQVCWQDFWPCGGPTLEQSVHEGLQPVGRTHVGEVCGELSPVRGTPRWSRGRVWGVLPPRSKEQQRHVMNWPQPPFPILLCCSGGRR